MGEVLTREDIVNMRKAMGTLPSQQPKKTYDYENDITSIYVKMTDHPHNPYEIITRAVTATWGDDLEGSTQKWEKLSPENRYRVVLSHLTGNTLPQASEGIQFQFEVNGLTRHDFDQHARARLGTHFMSIGTRDNCVLSGTKVLTSEGYANIEDVSEDNLVLTHNNNFKRVEKTSKRKYKGQAISIRVYGHSEPVVFTPEHPLFVISQSPGRRNISWDINNAEWILAKDVKKGDVVIEALGKYDQKNNTTFDISKYYDDLYIGNQTGMTYKKHHIDVGVKLNDITIDKNWARLIGWYLAEGCLKYRYDKNGNKIDPVGIVLCVGRSDYERGHIEELEEAINNIHPDIKIFHKTKTLKNVKTPQGNIVEDPDLGFYVHINHRQIARFIHEHFGEYSKYKRIPSWMFNLSNDIILNFLDAYYKGDGEISNDKRKGVSSISENIIEGISVLLNKIRSNHIYYLNRSTDFNNVHSIFENENEKKGSKIRIIGDYKFKIIKNIDLIDIEDYVYNLQVEEDNSYTLRHFTVHNCKLDSRFLFYDHIMQRMEKDPEYKKMVEDWVKLTKDLYEDTISENGSSWQIGRAFLPQSINHSYVFGINYIALKSQMGRRLMFCEQEGIVTLHWLIKKEIDDRFPLLGQFMRPACDRAKKCIYMEGPEGMTRYFSNLYNGCGRWPVIKKENQEYKEFNHSCTLPERLKELGIPIWDPEDYTHFGENDYDKLDPKDKELFEN